MCRVPSLLLRAGRGQGSQMVSAFQKVSRKSWGGGAVCEQLKEKGVMGTSESGVSGPRAYGQRVEQEAAALIFELGPSPSGPSYRVNQAGPSPWPWSPGSGRGRQTHLLGAPALRFSEDPGLCVHSLAPRKRQHPQKPPAGLAGPSTGTCRGEGGVPERYLPCAPQISFPPHFVDGKRLKFYFI